MKAEVPKDKFNNLTNSLYVLNGKLYMILKMIKVS